MDYVKLPDGRIQPGIAIAGQKQLTEAQIFQEARNLAKAEEDLMLKAKDLEITEALALIAPFSNPLKALQVWGADESGLAFMIAPVPYEQMTAQEKGVYESQVVKTGKYAGKTLKQKADIIKAAEEAEKKRQAELAAKAVSPAEAAQRQG